MTVLVAKLFFVCSSLKLNYKMEVLMFILPKVLLFVLLFLPACISKGIRKKKKKILTRNCDKHSKGLPLCFFQLTTPASRSVEEQTLGTVALNLLIS